MGWSRQQFTKVERKHLRHAHVALDKAYCVDCGRELQTTHLVARFGERCHRCFHALWQLPVVQVVGQERM
jgi:RNA polymerase-binding transcription factor DksA